MLSPMSYAAPLWNRNASAALSMAKLDPSGREIAMTAVHDTRPMNIYRAPYAWVLSADYQHLEQLIAGMETLSRRGEGWDYERDDKGLVKFGLGSQAAVDHFRAQLR